MCTHGWTRSRFCCTQTVSAHPSVTASSFKEINANVFSYQPFFSSATAAEPWLTAPPGSRAFTVNEMFERSWYIHYRDSLRPLVHAPSRD
jgi:hypothetical protein